MSDQLSTDLAALKIDRARAPRRRGPLWTLLGLALLLGAGALAYGYAAPMLEAKIFKTAVEATEIASVSPAQARVELTSSGYVVAETESKLAAKVAGKISKVFVKQGDSVKQGQILFLIDPADQNAAISAGVSQIGSSEAAAKTARANLAEAKIQAEREQALAAEGLSPKGNAEDRLARVASLEAAVKAAEALAQAQRASVGALRVNLENFTVRAPIDGIVVNKPPQVGEFVGPQPAGIAADMGGVQIADFDSLMVETDVPEQRLSQVRLGGPCEITLDAFPSKRYRGKAVEVTPLVNRAKATVTIKVAFVDDKPGVLPDMAARVSFLNGELDAQAIKEPPKVVVPAEAVSELNGAKVVYVIEDGKVRISPVTLGPSFGDGFELLKGPRPGTRVVKAPPAGLADGQSIKERTEG